MENCYLRISFPLWFCTTGTAGIENKLEEDPICVKSKYLPGGKQIEFSTRSLGIKVKRHVLVDRLVQNIKVQQES